MDSLILVLFLNVSAQAAPSPCHYVVTVSENPVKFAYDIDKAYQASTLVVIGKANDYTMGSKQKVHVTKVIKGNAGSEIILEGMHQSGTDPWGTAVPPSKDFLMMFQGKDVFNWVDSGSSCGDSFEIQNGKVKIGENAVKVENIKTFFDSHPKPIQVR